MVVGGAAAVVVGTIEVEGTRVVGASVATGIAVVLGELVVAVVVVVGDAVGAVVVATSFTVSLPLPLAARAATTPTSRTASTTSTAINDRVPDDIPSRPYVAAPAEVLTAILTSLPPPSATLPLAAANAGCGSVGSSVASPAPGAKKSRGP